MEHILVVVDSFTKYVFMKAVPSTATKYTVRALEEISGWLGMPETIISDRGTFFTSGEFKRFCQEHAIHYILNAVHTPRANGQVERMNRTILSMLLPLTKKNSKWDEGLRQIQWSINSTRNTTTQRSPHDLIFGFQPRDILANKLVLILYDLSSEPDEGKTGIVELDDMRATRSTQHHTNWAKAKDRYVRKHATPKRIVRGDLALASNEAVSMGTSRKFEPKFKGPFIVTSVLGNDRCTIEDIPGVSRNQRHYRPVTLENHGAPSRQMLKCRVTQQSARTLITKDGRL